MVAVGDMPPVGGTGLVLATSLVGAGQADPSLKAPRFQSLVVKKDITVLSI